MEEEKKNSEKTASADENAGISSDTSPDNRENANRIPSEDKDRVGDAVKESDGSREEPEEDISQAEHVGYDYSFDSEEDDFSVTEYDSGNIEPDKPAEESYEPADAVEEETERRGERAKEARKKAKKPLIITLIILAAALIGIFAYGIIRIPGDSVMKNVYIDSLDVGGLTYEGAIDAVRSSYLLQDNEITLICADKSFSITSSDIDMLAIPENSAQKAFDYCRSGNLIIDGFNSLKLLFSKHIIMPAVQVNEEKLNEKINEFGNIVLGERKPFTVEIGEDNIATVYSGQTGYNMQPDTAREEILTALGNDRFENIYVSFESAPPESMTIESFDLLVYKDPVDARYEVSDNSVEVIAEENGRYIDKEEAALLLNNVYEGCEPVAIPYYVSYPSVTAQTLRDRLFANTLSSYSTSYSGSTSNRCANISRAASLINGTVIAPGGVFSFNDTVGHRTVSNGFYTAKEYINGESVDGIGGGTCQVSSTLYSAALYADMEIVERLNHMMTVGYIPLGQDATVSDGGVDFKFKNTSEYPVKISAYTSGSSITISIIGADWEPHREIKLAHSQSMSGENTVVYSTRYVYANGELISADTLNSSTYMPHKQ